ncbi:ABC transporter permease [Galbitalea soli]|uniref:Transport permease protein n=1 Tax=Galbitalea soli TaxID=1268042 RepID=A0A7C9TR04_9MICO|nr:ABC transporter permease [Galbitalea soli]NEM91281.1 ABC transporter permease [Galbitalea soli]NYJ29970.1 lipooligosaccharide transport system permease protein [Galbitalea soli]
MTSTPTVPSLVPPTVRPRLLGALYAGNARAVVSRGALATRSTNYLVVLSGFFEPIFYLVSLGYGLNKLVGTVETTTGQPVSYAAFIAPALLAVAAMNGAIYDSTWNVFFKMNYSKLYSGMLSTSLGPLDVALGEILLALARGGVYAIGFMIVMQVLGLNLAWTAILALPAVLLIAFGFASFGMAVTSYMKTFQQMDWINFVMMPMFLFSATFYPVTVYPPVVQVIVEALPLWQGVELVRGLTTGALSIAMLGHVLYFAVMIAIGLVFTTRRLRALFLD